MISASTAATVLSSGVSLVLLWVLVFWFYRRYRVDLYRERVFALRQELFVLAYEGEIRFTDTAYILTRTTLNGFIRFGHRVNVSSVIAATWAFRKDLDSESGFHSRFAKAVEPLPSETREKLEGIVQRMNIFTLEQVIFGSPLFMMLLVPAVVVLVAKHAGSEAVRRLLSRKWVRPALDPVDSVALHFGRAGPELRMAA